MSDDFDYAAAWHTLAGWVNGMAERDGWRPVPDEIIDELTAGYALAVQEGSRYGQTVA